MKKRFIALLLSIVTLMSLAVPGVAAADDTGLVVTPASATLPKGGSTELTASALPEGSTPQWQIAAGEVWVDIAGESAATLTLTYAKVASLLRDGVAQLRCVARLNGETVDESESVAVAVDESAVGVVTGGVAAGTVIRDAYVTQGPYITAPAVSAPAVSTPSFSAGSAASSGSTGTYGFAVGNPDPVAPGSPGYTARNYTATYDLGAVTADTNSEPTLTQYSIVINYVFENGDIVSEPWTATIAAGSSLTATVAHPVVQGYLPYIGEETETSSILPVNVTNIQAPVTYTVVYKPTNVNYTVTHFQQNAENDQYVEVLSEIKQGLTGSTVPEVAKDYSGFTALLYERPAIAADGSTVVEIKYDRNYYLMNFDLDGGYGVEAIYDRFETPIGDVGTPTKAGYTFKGWSLDGTNVIAEGTFPTTMPAENRTYKALWDDDPTAKVTVVFWGQNANDEDYSYIMSAQLDAKVGMSFTYTEEDTLICGQEEHTHSDACVACGQTAHTHSIENGCYTLTCGQTSHQHDTKCYDGVGDRQNFYTDVPGNPSEGQVHDHWFYGKLIYIDGIWYRYSGTTAADSVAPTICGQTESNHTHSDSCYTLTCTQTAHTHSEECGYDCGQTEHHHTSACHMADAGLDSNLWTFVQSDTVTVAADGSTVVNVYYDRTSFTLTFHYNYNAGYQSTGTITAKWDADIGERFIAMNTAASGNLWSENRDGKSPWTSYLQIMPQENRDYYCRNSSSTEQTAEYYVETLTPGEYALEYSVTAYYDSNLTISKEDFYPMEGYTYSHGVDGEGDAMGSPGQYGDFDGAKFYYTRNSYTLNFNNGLDVVKSESVKYEMPLGSYAFTPEAPILYEPGSVEFAGWYLNPECTGAQYKLDEHTMPSSNLILYAKWVPVTHTVEFYLDKEAYEAGNKLNGYPDQTVSHGKKLEEVLEKPTHPKGDYNFIGWFYVDEMGEEKAFDFANMAVNRDMQVYGKWSSNVLKSYFVYYKIKGTDTEIAKPTTGSALAGESKTFDAKGGSDLYADYQEGYFPEVQSHTMLLEIENDKNNVYTFEYVQKEAVPYSVRYLIDNGDGTYTPAILNEDGTEYIKTVDDNRKAVVTENFRVVPGYMPDKYQKRLVVSGAEGAVNEIIFYYVKDEAHAYYKITHYTQNLDGTTYTEYTSSQIVGDINSYYTGTPMNIDGFTYERIEYIEDGRVIPASEITKDGAQLTNKGLEINLYYVRNEYPYLVRYHEVNTEKELQVPKTGGTGKYGQVVSEDAIPIEDYDLVSATPQNINIRIEELNEGEQPQLNVITFYYKEKEVVINYVVDGPAGCGSVSIGQEKLQVLSGTANGSTAIPNDGFRFIGWYDKDGKLLSTKVGYVPEKVNGKNVAATYTAKFEYDLTDLTIEKIYPKGKDQNQSAKFTVVTKNANDEVTYRTAVVLPNNGEDKNSVTITGLKVGDTVTVTEENRWTWRYAVSNNKGNNTEGSLVLASDAAQNTVTFTNTRAVSKWLSGANFAVNTYGSATAVRGYHNPTTPDAPPAATN